MDSIDISTASSYCRDVPDSSSSTAARSQLSDDVKDNPNGQISARSCLKEFSLADLRTAASNFGPEAWLGEGSYGRVYKGWIDEKTLAPAEWGTGMPVAVKILKCENIQAFEQWRLEVNILGRLYHPNLIELLGYCWEGELVLLYEVMQKGSLENHLFQSDVFEPLSWDIRLKIVIGAARGLAYLHTLKKEIIYRDFKPSIIMVDANYNPKLSDFGLVKLGPFNNKTHVTTRTMCTNGHADPKYYLHDSKRQTGEQNLVKWLKPSLCDERKLKTYVDAGMEGQYRFDAALQAAQLTVVCLASSPKNRPSMKEVLEALEQIEAMKDKPDNS